MSRAGRDPQKPSAKPVNLPVSGTADGQATAGAHRSSPGPCRAVRGGVALAVAMALGIASAAVPLQASAGSDTWFAQRVTSGDAPLRIDNLWSRGSRLRAEIVIAGRPILTLVTPQRYMIIDSLMARGVSIQRSKRAMAADDKRKRPFGNEGDEILRQGGEKVGSDRIAQRACDLYRVTDRVGRREICLTSDELRLPLQVEVWVRGGGQSVTARYLDWTRGFEVPDAFFEPDPRVKLEEIDYEAYVSRSRKEAIGPAPPLFADLLHGQR